jgi:hypothetical protein
MAGGKVYYNYEMQEFGSNEAPGISVFYRDTAGDVFHTYSSYGRGLDPLIGAYQLLDLVPKGRNEDQLDSPMALVRAKWSAGRSRSSRSSAARKRPALIAIRRRSTRENFLLRSSDGARIEIRRFAVTARARRCKLDRAERDPGRDAQMPSLRGRLRRALHWLRHFSGRGRRGALARCGRLFCQPGVSHLQNTSRYDSPRNGALGSIVRGRPRPAVAPFLGRISPPPTSGTAGSSSAWHWTYSVGERSRESSCWRPSACDKYNAGVLSVLSRSPFHRIFRGLRRAFRRFFGEKWPKCGTIARNVRKHVIFA